MKPTALLTLTLIYLLSCSGIAVNRFYCCGKLASTTLIYAFPDHADIKAGKNDCCKNERQNFKIKDNHLSASSVLLTAPMPVILPQFYATDQLVLTSVLSRQRLYQSKAPPGPPDIPIYTLNCTYRI